MSVLTIAQVHVDEIRKETDKALLVRRDDVLVWLPLSQVERITRLRDGRAVIFIPDWLADEKGLFD